MAKISRSSIRACNHFVDLERNEHPKYDKEAKNKVNQTLEHQVLSSRLETKALQWLKSILFLVLLCSAIFLCVSTYFYIQGVERRTFKNRFQADARIVVDSFHDAVGRQLGAINSLSTSFTSFANYANMTFPNVTLPDFETQVSDTRVLAEALFIAWFPLVTDETRRGWEEYALQHRFHIDISFERDKWQRAQQDKFFGNVSSNHHHSSQRILNELFNEGNPYVNSSANQLKDGSGYHPLIWNGDVYNQRKNRGVAEPIGSGPFLPVWQMSPVNELRQASINMNMETTKVWQETGLLAEVLRSEQATLAKVNLPHQVAKKGINYFLLVGQYRHDYENYRNDPLTFLAYPVFDSFDQDKRKIVGIISSSLYWRMLFHDVLSTNSKGIICVLQNSFNQSFAFRLDGSQAKFVGDEALEKYREKYAALEHSVDVNTYLAYRASPENMGYTSVPLNSEFGRYTLSVFPTQATEDQYISNKPTVYTISVTSVWIFTVFLFVLYDYFGERRQRLIRNRSLENAHRAAVTEREMNEYISHEVRNPLTAALTACHFVSSALTAAIEAEQKRKMDGVETNNTINRVNSSQKTPSFQLVKDDVDIIQSSLKFVDSLLRGMLDLHISEGDEMELRLSPTDIVLDVFEPVISMVYTRYENFELQLECCGITRTSGRTNLNIQNSRRLRNSTNLTIMSDPLRLKQIILNLVRNSTKFVKQGFIRLRADVIEGNVVLYVEDSGPGIPASEHPALFTKFKGTSSLDMLRQGTGVGLCLCSKLTQVMKGDLWLDESYDSGIQGFPGCRFVLQLNTPPIDLSEYETTTEASSEGAASISSELVLPANKSVLLVDDDLMIRKLFRRAALAVAPDWSFQEAASGETALDLAIDGDSDSDANVEDAVTNDANKFDLIFMDQYMPGTERQLLGTETIRMMRLKGVRSVICGLSANDLKEAFLEAGADAFVLKPLPCNKEELKQLLHGLLRDKRC